MNGRLALPLPPAAASTSCGQPRVEGTTKRAMNFPLIINRWLSASAKLENSAGLARVRAGRYRADANSNSEITFAAWNPHLIDAPVRSGSRAVHAEPPDRNEAVTRCSIGPRPSGIMSLLMGSLYSAPTYHTMLIEPPHAFRVLPHTSPLRYPRPSYREMVQSDQGLRFRLTR